MKRFIPSFFALILSFGCVQNDFKVKLDSGNISGNSFIAVGGVTSATEDVVERITLNYSDKENRIATSCEVSSLLNITEYAECGCDSFGVCTVEVLGTPDFFGAASFDFKIISNDKTSNIATQSVLISNVDDAPVASNLAPSTQVPEVESIISLSYIDVDGDLASSCSISNLSNLTETSSCSCDSQGACSVGVTSTPGYIGAVSFSYSVTSNRTNSNLATVNYSVAIPRKPFVSVWKVGEAGYGDGSNTIKLPLENSSGYNFTVDWGDGKPVETFTGPDASHTYDTPGDYTVTIDGSVSHWGFNNRGDAGKLIHVRDLGRIGLTSLRGGFYGCNQLLTFAGGDTSDVREMQSLFSGASKLTSLDISSFNTSNVQNMNYMFFGLSSLTTLNLSNLDTSRVTGMDEMFFGSSKIQTLDLSKFKTSNVSRMTKMFTGMSSLTSINLAGFDTSKINSFERMFENVSKLETLDLSSFNTSNVTSMVSMFFGMSSLKNLNVSSFNTSNVTTMLNMFYEVAELENLDLSNFRTPKVEYMGSMFSGMSKLSNLNISNFSTLNVSSMSYMFYDAKELVNLNLSNFHTPRLENMYRMFKGTSKLESLDISNFNTALVKDMSELFYDTSALKALDLSSFDTSNVTDMTHMFRGARSITSLDLRSFTTVNVRSLYGMFYEANSLANLEISVWDLSNLPAGGTYNMWYGTHPSLIVKCVLVGADFSGKTCQ